MTAEKTAPVDAASRHIRFPSMFRAIAAIGLPTMLVTGHAQLYGRWIVDDAAITFAYARSVATGAGPVLQPGADSVEGWSNPAWLGLLVIARWLRLFDHGTWFGVPDYVAFPKALALMCCAGLFGCFYAAARALSARPALVTVMAGSVVAALPSFVIWVVSGLENSLLALAAVGIAAISARAAACGRLLEWRPALVCGLLGAAAALTRPDGLVYVGAYPVAALLASRRHELLRAAVMAVGSVAAFALPAGVYLAWRVATFGTYLPNTALAKAQGLPGLDHVDRPIELVGYLGWLPVSLAIAVIGAALAGSWAGRRGLVVWLVPLALALAAYAMLAADPMVHYRFATPVWALAAFAAALAATQVWPLLAARGRGAVATAAVVALVVSGVRLSDGVRVFRAEPTTPLCLVAQNTGRNFNGYADIIRPPNATILAPDIGGAALTSRLRIVDLAGLAHSRIARYWHDKDWTGFRDFVFDDTRPTFIKSHGGWSSTTGLTTDPRLTRDYVEVGTTEGTTDWVSRDALGDPALFGDLRDYHARVAAPADASYRFAPRSSCGARLRPGS